ncbi:D-alanyl-D-alanine carboxypeptidase DacB precursor [Pirellula sp. SH-Sr6A]|uniref:serine hydrolase n=1 Tax=Pirellula sp. SH-Sr6A TaxID=1632865 RepID=UPI00078BBEE4|nr:serine hydrolase [Pirellula sp. SH-Sr6A]AMV34515.1 D-alanyl-D-alanine carboxypeptidase DacB precursor [Pirellula sp. SH-Sr6A]
MFHLRMNWIAICIAIAWVHPSAISYAQLASQFDPLIRNHQGEVAVAIKNLDTGELYQHNETTVMPTASLIKFPVLVELYRQVDAGNLRLDRLVTLQDSDKVPGSGILTDHFQSGSQIPLETIARLMIRYSDNTATNLVLDQIGMENTSKTMLQLGFRETRLHSKVFRRDTSVAPERSQKYGLGSTTAAEMLGLLELLHAKMLVSEKASEQMLTHLASCEDDSKLVRDLPKAVKSFHKTGSVNDVRTDAGLFQTPKGTLAIVVLTAKNQDTSWGNANAAELLCAKIGSTAYEWFNPPGTSTAVKPEVVKIGASGDTVKALQRALNEKLSPSPDLTVDGDFGGMTESAVKRFQTANQLPETGLVDANTWEKLGPIQIASSDPEPVRPLPEKRAADTLDGAPFVSCKAWVAVDTKTGKIIDGSQHDTPLDFASTTKMMTAWLIAKEAEKNPAILDEVMTYSERADGTIGSTSDVRSGESLKVREALYGLMLPSGNDASVAFAEHFGERLKPADWDESRDPLDMFVAAMNHEAQTLGMKKTTFKNPHGLTHPDHKSTCAELATLASKVIASDILSGIISCREYRCTLSSTVGYQREVLWRNTNQLLDIDGYLGVKTGTTDAAGACLVSCSEREGERILIVVLGASGSAARYADSRNLHRWAWKNR